MSLIHLFLGVLVLFIVAVAAGDVVQIDSLVNQCQFMVDGNAFNLCPLLDSPKQGGWLIEYERQTPPTVLMGQYRIMFDGSLPKNESLDDDMQCPPGTAICLTTYTRHSGSPIETATVLNTIPVAGTLSKEAAETFVKWGTYHPGLNVQAQMVTLYNKTEESLRIDLQGGYYVYERQFATVHFICDQDHAKTNLKYLWTIKGNHIFSWTSPHSCIQSRAEPPPGSPPDRSGGEQELVTPPIGNRSQRALWTLVLVTTCATGAVAYLIYFPPRTLRRVVSRYLKDHPSLLRFRVGENVLIRWAHEEIDLDEDEPFVVEGDDINHYVDDEEFIPLKPSPRKGGFVTYGST